MKHSRIRLLHISDLHVGQPFRRVTGEALVRAAATIDPDVVVLSGDAVEWGENRRSWARACELIERFDAPLAIVPGNHDQARAHLLQRWRTPLRNYLDNFGPKEDTVLAIAGATLVCLATPRRWSLDLGCISPEQLQWARDAFEAAPTGDLRCVVMHHGLRQLSQLPMRDRVYGDRLAVWSFADMGVDLVMTGHNHFPHVETLGGNPGFVWSQAGTATARRYRNIRFRKNSVSLVTFADGNLRIEWLYYDRGAGEFSVREVHSFQRPTPARRSA